MRINMKMKMLSLAVVGLGGLALAGTSAAAACPAGPTVAQGGAWTDAQVAQGTVAVVAGGLGGTACRLDSSFSAGAGPFSAAAVHDASPNSEPRYRAAFIIDLDQLTSAVAPGFATSANIFTATSAGSPLTLGVFGDGTNWNLSYFLANGSVSGSVPLQAGQNHIEFDLQISASGTLTVWVNNNVSGTPTIAPVSIDNSSMVGINDAYLGLSTPSPQFVSNYPSVPAEFDQFDSRRSSFIGY